MKVGSLFAGIGGFDLAARWMNWETIWFSEIDPYASKVLEKHWPAVPNLGDITKIDWSTVEQPDLLCGGFPCQPHSIAGDREGGKDERDLWPECVRALRGLRPRWAVFENVPGLFSSPESDPGAFFNRILSDLAEAGYDAEWTSLSAGDLAALHLRERVWIVASANPIGVRPQGLRQAAEGPWAWEQFEGLVQAELRVAIPAGESGGVSDGVFGRTHRLKALGNAIVPQCAYQVFLAIQEAEERCKETVSR